jgi:hypothetical protein
MAMHRSFGPALVSATLTLLATARPSAASSETVANARNATAIYNDPAAALAGGYDLLTDAAGIACIDLPGTGGMGVHYVNRSARLLLAARLDLEAQSERYVRGLESAGAMRGADTGHCLG